MPKFKLDLTYRGDTAGLVTTFRGNTGTVRLFIDRDDSDRCVATAGGGGYDKRGTCLGEFLTDTFQPELLKIANRAGSTYRDTADGLQRVEDETAGRYDSRALYGMTTYRNRRGKAERVRLDGGCGYESMVRIAEAIGLRIEFAGETRDAYVHILRGLAKIRDRREAAERRAAEKTAATA